MCDKDDFRVNIIIRSFTCGLEASTMGTISIDNTDSWRTTVGCCLLRTVSSTVNTIYVDGIQGKAVQDARREK